MICDENDRTCAEPTCNIELKKTPPGTVQQSYCETTTCPNCGQVWSSDGSVEKLADVWCNKCMERMKELHTTNSFQV